MAYEITPIKFWELDTFIYHQRTTFASSDVSLERMFLPNGYTVHMHTFARRGLEKDYKDPHKLCTLIRDPATKQIAGGAKWEIKSEADAIESLIEAEQQGTKEGEETEEVRKDVNFAAMDASHLVQSRCRREIMKGQPHVYLCTLFVLPEHQRRGVGHAAMQWGMEKADALGLPAYLEGSEAGKGLYERWGFEFVKLYPLDTRAWGSPDAGAHYCKVRKAKNDVSGDIPPAKHAVLQ
ncbi:hypothetical protein AAFC00_001657 [Neodothiora populina]|uniref:N-acetyltransferase domain-containing protein n=1 Tax=Neodothiora populina TaxID=2781224 RepID=A0ABR3PPR3_9PEZI